MSAGGAIASGGAQSTGGTKSTGGTPSTGGSTGNPNTVGPTKTCGCLTSSGNYSGNPLTATIVVNNGETYDGGCKTYTTKSLASGGLGDGSQEEDQKPLFRVNAGGKLINVILGAPAADGVHFYGNATAQNIHWLDIGEDAATIKGDATVTLDCGSAKNGSDKVFQVNAKATWNISNFTIRGAGKAMRENGDQCYPITAVFDHCDISDLDEVIFRTDCTSSKVTISNTRYSGIGDGLVLIGSTIHNSSSGNVTITNVQKY
jgi:pectate lyase C